MKTEIGLPKGTLWINEGGGEQNWGAKAGNLLFHDPTTTSPP